jgi:1,3-beta-glucan synthase
MWLEFDLKTAIAALIKDFLAFNWFFFLFSMQTKAFHFAYGLTYGRAAYIATGRGYAMESHSVVHLYHLYAQSHIYLGMEVFSLLFLYLLLQKDWAVGFVTTWSVAFLVFSLIFGAFFFNPFAWTKENVEKSFWEWMLWMEDGVPATVGRGGWHNFHNNRMSRMRSNPLWKKWGILFLDAVPRAALCAAGMMAVKLKVAANDVLALGSTAEVIQRVIAFAVAVGILFGLSVAHFIIDAITSRSRVFRSRVLRWPVHLLGRSR